MYFRDLPSLPCLPRALPVRLHLPLSVSAPAPSLGLVSRYSVLLSGPLWRVSAFISAVWGFFPYYPTIGRQLSSGQCPATTTPCWHRLPRGSIRFHRLRAQSCETALCFSCQSKARGVTCASDPHRDQRSQTPPEIRNILSTRSPDHSAGPLWASLLTCTATWGRTTRHGRLRPCWPRWPPCGIRLLGPWRPWALLTTLPVSAAPLRPPLKWGERSSPTSSSKTEAAFLLACIRPSQKETEGPVEMVLGESLKEEFLSQVLLMLHKLFCCLINNNALTSIVIIITLTSVCWVYEWDH